MHSTLFSSTFLRFLKFPQIKEGERHLLGGGGGGAISAEQLSYLVPPYVFQF